MRILLDLDEVLCDFVGGVCNYWAITQDALLPHWEPGSWDIVSPLGRTLVNHRRRLTPITTQEFWNTLRWNATFWETLKPLPNMEDVLRVARWADPEFVLVTTPSRCSSSYVGKLNWVRRHLGERFNRFVLTGDKSLMAHPDAVLVDDKEENVVRFQEAGGRGILYPRYHNRLYNIRTNPIPHLLNQLAAVAAVP